jgi:hypothetical protein
MNVCPNCKQPHDSTACPTPSGEGLGAMPCSLKIIQIMIAPNDATWQGVLLGLGDDGNVYAAGGCGWEPYFEGKLSRENTEVSHDAERRCDH